MTNECDHGQLKRVCRECELEAEIEALRAQVADCQAVIRHKGHDADCPGRRCSFDGFIGKCWVSRAFHDEHKLGHEYQSPPCSDACGHDRTTGETA